MIDYISLVYTIVIIIIATAFVFNLALSDSVINVRTMKSYLIVIGSIPLSCQNIPLFFRVFFPPSTLYVTTMILEPV